MGPRGISFNLPVIELPVDEDAEASEGVSLAVNLSLGSWRTGGAPRTGSLRDRDRRPAGPGVGLRTGRMLPGLSGSVQVLRGCPVWQEQIAYVRVEGVPRGLAHTCLYRGLLIWGIAGEGRERG